MNFKKGDLVCYITDGDLAIVIESGEWDRQISNKRFPFCRVRWLTGGLAGSQEADKGRYGHRCFQLVVPLTNP
jgi:hypothetical protein